MKELIAYVICSLLTISAAGKVITVDDNGPADFADIQEAIVHAANGDIIEVQPGVYSGNINFYGKAVTLTSIEPGDPNVVATTIIDRRQGFNTVQFDCGEDNSSVLRGFSIRATNLAKDTGVGVHCYHSSPLIRDNIIFDHGTGVRAEAAYPVLVDNVIRDNSGAGLERCSGQIAGCTVEDNGGDGLYDCDGPIVDCVVAFNSGFGLASCDDSITNCLITSNAGGLRDCNGQIGNCTVAYHQGDALQGCHGQIKNCIMAFNGRYGLNNCLGTHGYNNVWANVWGNYAGGTLPGIGDIHADPLFEQADGFHVKSEAGRWDPSLEQWIIDEVTSPCVDAGDPCDSIGYEPTPNGGRINMGAYGGTVEASKSPYGSGPNPPPICLERPAMDFNHDCKVDFADLARFLLSWLDCNLDPPEACWE